MALDLKCIVGTNLVRLTYSFTSRYFHFSILNKVDRFSHRGCCGVVGVICVLKLFKEELAWATDKRLQITCNTKQLCRYGTEE